MVADRLWCWSLVVDGLIIVEQCDVCRLVWIGVLCFDILAFDNFTEYNQQIQCSPSALRDTRERWNSDEALVRLASSLSPAVCLMKNRA